eukprot:gnl/TRDRNA2_/TRDRNA2_74769_c0_seq2.p2 gnl/TRDRNA2_/TRDRNA2_74769_c0~~gnl/TRDRNA2_/TRDRNA2_74769_c0_seq2.p2  ORF type:complete len:121 (-),score=9.78 gnl/TRDRNA2_/TRDRNA2_74769_c0_seq2:133-444(-)
MTIFADAHAVLARSWSLKQPMCRCTDRPNALNSQTSDQVAVAYAQATLARSYDLNSHTRCSTTRAIAADQPSLRRRTPSPSLSPSHCACCCTNFADAEKSTLC